MLIKRRADNVLRDHYFIFPFKCDRCKNWFMLEHGCIRKHDAVSIIERALDRITGVNGSADVYCGLCSIDVIHTEEVMRQAVEERERREAAGDFRQPHR